MNLRLPAELRRPLRPARGHPGRRAAGGLHRPLSSTTPTSCRGASRSPTWWSIAEDRRRPHRHAGRARGGAGAPRRPAPQDRQLLGRLQRHRHHQRCPRGERPAPPPRGRGLLRLRGAAPYVAIDMGSGTRPDHLDAIFLSPHKFIGGPGTPGVLVARRELFRNRVPTMPGGGTVAYVNPSEHVYLSDIEHREEGGTPAIVESIRAGLVFQLKEAVGTGRHPRARGVLHHAGHRPLAGPPAHRGAGQPGRRTAVDRVVRRPLRPAATSTTTTSWRC